MNNNKCIQRSFILSICTVFVFLLLPHTAIAASYYVSPSGNDANTGLTTSAAWKTPSYAASKAVAGDTIYLMDGTWYDQHVMFKNRGTASSPITMKAYSGTPVLDGVDKTGIGIQVYASSWINVEGIKVKNYQYGYWVSSSDNVKVTKCEFSDTALDGITMWNNVKYFTIDSVIVKNTGDHGIHLWNQNSPGRSQFITVKNTSISNAPHNLFDVHTNVTDVVIENNELFFSKDYTGEKQVGLFLHNGNTDNIVIKNNYFHDQARPLEIFNSKNIQVMHNTFRNIDGRAIFLASISGYDDELGVYDSVFKGNTFDNVNYAFGFWGADTKFINLDLMDNIYLKVLNPNYPRPDVFYFALSGTSGFPQVLSSRNTYYTVHDIVKSPIMSTDKTPVANAGPDRTIITGSSVSFDGSASTDDKGISAYSWDFDASNGIQNDASGKSVSRVFNTAGKFTVTLTVTDTAGQRSTDTCIVTVNAPTTSGVVDKPPVANAGYDRVTTVGQRVYFSGASSTDDKGIVSYAWDFDASNGIQTDASGMYVSTTFSKAQTYTVTLTVTDTKGQKSSNSAYVKVNPVVVDKPPVAPVVDNPPVANAGPDRTINAGSSVSFDASASTDDKGISAYSWDFDAANGIQNDASGKTVSRVFNTAGKFTVTLTVTDTAGQRSTDTCIVTVNAPVAPVVDKPPVANAGPDRTINTGSSVSFDGSASTDDKGISAYSWDFDAVNDIQNDVSGKTVSRVFNTAGKFTVTLTVTDTAGQRSTDTCIVTVNAPVAPVVDKPPVANAGYDRVATVGQRLYFGGDRSTDDKGIVSYAWDFDASNGIQTDASGMYVSTTFSKAQTYTVTLTVTDTKGQKSSHSVNVKVNPVVVDKPPVANAGPDVSITTGVSVMLNGGASTDDKGIASYSWDFDASNGIQNDASGKTVSRVFNTVGKFTVTLTVTDTAGQKSTDTCIVNVSAPAVRP